MPGSSNSSNHFLASLSAQDSQLVRPHLRPTDLPLGTVFYRAEDTINRIYFPETGVVSLVVGLRGGQFVEAGMFGRNSVIGGSALLDGPVALHQAISQVAGSGLAGDAHVLKNLVDESETLRNSLISHEHMILAHAQQVAACNALHELEERLSRWLLQTRDLVQSDTLPLTQEFLSQMLGVQRSSVTLVARRLQQDGLITYRRGLIHIIDVEALEHSCCECYDAINAHFRRLTSWTPR